MRVHAKDGDSPIVVDLMSQIDRAWAEFIDLRDRSDKALSQHGLLRAALRLEMEGLTVGSVITVKRGLNTSFTGTLECSEDAPYLWIRMIGKTGAPSKRRRQFDEDAVFSIDETPPQT